MNGRIVRMTPKKGFGFIKGVDNTDYFFHFSALKNSDMKELTEGREVEFQPTRGSKGPRAEDIYV